MKASVIRSSRSSAPSGTCSWTCPSSQCVSPAPRRQRQSSSISGAVALLSSVDGDEMACFDLDEAVLACGRTGRDACHRRPSADKPLRLAERRRGQLQREVMPPARIELAHAGLGSGEPLSGSRCKSVLCQVDWRARASCGFSASPRRPTRDTAGIKAHPRRPQQTASIDSSSPTAGARPCSPTAATGSRSKRPTCRQQSQPSGIVHAREQIFSRIALPSCLPASS
jgi:hypothetical protein